MAAAQEEAQDRHRAVVLPDAGLDDELAAAHPYHVAARRCARRCRSILRRSAGLAVRFGARRHAMLPKRAAERARARSASTSRSRGSALVTSESIRRRAAAAMSSTASSNAAWLAFDGL